MVTDHSDWTNKVLPMKTLCASKKEFKRKLSIKFNLEMKMKNDDISFFTVKSSDSHLCSKIYAKGP